MSKVSFAEPEESPAADPAQLSVERIVGEVQPDGSTVWRQLHLAPPTHALPFGVMPYPTDIAGHPAYGAPYSYPRTPRRLGGRLSPPPFQPQPLPAIGAVMPAPACPPQPVVVYRPTPVKNFVSLLTAPRPYVAYDPYAVYPAHPLYVPVQ